MKRKTVEVQEELPQAKRSRQEQYVFKVGAWSTPFQEILQASTKEVDRLVQTRALVTAVDAIKNARLAQSQHGIDIEAKLNGIRQMFHAFRYTPTEHQRMLLDYMLVVCMRWVVGAQFELYKPRILRALKLVEIFLNFHLITPRQYGKSTGVAMAVLALALKIAGLRICIFSPGKRQSVALMKMIRDCLRSLPNYDEYVIKETDEELVLSTVPLQSKTKYDSRLTSTIKCFPANANSKSCFP